MCLGACMCTKFKYIYVLVCDCVLVCEGEARLLCRGEADTSMVALCLLAQEAKGHETGINYIVREGCVYVCWTSRFPFLNLFVLVFTSVFHACIQSGPA